MTKLNASGSALVYSTFLGGSGVRRGATGIAVDGEGRAYVTGITVSADYPTTPGAFDTTFNGDRDAFVTKLNASGSALVYSTFLGGASDDEGFGIAVDGEGRAYVTGAPAPPTFPPPQAPSTPPTTAASDAFVTKLNASGSALAYSTFLGGTISMRAWASRCERAGPT